MAFGISVMLTGCSQSEDFAEYSAGTDSEITEDTPMQINLAIGVTPSVVAKSSVESEGSNNCFAADGIGLFMLAKSKTGVNANAQDVTWDPADTYGTYGAWWDNLEANATIEYEDVEGTQVPKQTVLTYTNVDKYKDYYPTGNWYTYDFYAYYPRVTSGLTQTATLRSVDFEINGTQDIIWGKASSTEEYAYSAKYFRMQEHAEEVPNIAMNHKLFRLQFASKAGADAFGSKAGALTMGIKSITMYQIPTKGTLVIADSEDAANEGVLTFDWQSSALSDVEVKDAGDAPFTGFDDHRVDENETLDVGQGIMLAVPEDGSEYIYKVNVVLQDEFGTEYPAEHPIELRPATGKFEAGKSYRVVMTINGPKIIDVTLSLTPWDTATEDIPLEF